MKITRKKLRQLINEEMEAITEAVPPEYLTYDDAREKEYAAGRPWEHN